MTPAKKSRRVPSSPPSQERLLKVRNENSGVKMARKQTVLGAISETLIQRHMNFMNFSLASSMSSAETVVAPRSLANRSISLRAMG